MRRLLLAAAVSLALPTAADAQFRLELGDETLRPPGPLPMLGTPKPGTPLPGTLALGFPAPAKSFGFGVGDLVCPAIGDEELAPYQERFMADRPFVMPEVVPPGGWSPSPGLWLANEPEKPWRCPSGTRRLSEVRVAIGSESVWSRTDTDSSSHAEQRTNRVGGKVVAGGKLGPVKLGGEVSGDRSWGATDQTASGRSDLVGGTFSKSWSANVEDGGGCLIEPYSKRYEDAITAYELRRDDWARAQVERDRMSQYATQLETHDAQQFTPATYESVPAQDDPTSTFSSDGLDRASQYATDLGGGPKF